MCIVVPSLSYPLKLGRLFYWCLACLACLGCNPDDVSPSERYPAHIARILRRTCATKGCHTAVSADAAAGLNLESWDKLFLGSRGGSAVIPYSPEQSFLLYSVNTDSTQGAVLYPTMPIGAPALSAEEYADLRQWILEGARNAKDQERFAPSAARRKWYVANRGCDLVTVLDAASNQVMRYVPVGNNINGAEQPAAIAVSPDGLFWYVAYGLGNANLSKYSTLTDEKVADIDLGHTLWRNMTISPDGRWAFVVSAGTRDLAVVDLARDARVGPVVPVYRGVNGVAVHPLYARLYMPHADSSALVLMDYNSSGQLSNWRQIDLVQGQSPTIPGQLQPLEVTFLPDGSKYFVACSHSDEVRVYDGATDALLAVVPVGAFPTTMAYAATTGQLLVACMRETAAFGGDPHKVGAIAAIDVASHARVAMVYAGYQPFGIAVDAAGGHLVVANRNLGGVGQHHPSTCAGSNGYLTLLDLQTLQLQPEYKMELSVDPVAVAVKR